MREQKMSSSGSATHALARTVKYDLHGSPALVRLAQRIGSPFVEPAAFVWSLIHHVPIATFEQVVGTFFLDRDGQWFTILTRTLELTRPNRYFVASGLRWQDEKGPPEVVGPARLILYMFAKEQIELELVGTFLPGATTIRWNDVDVPLVRNGDRLRAIVSKDVALAGTNEVELVLPVGSKLAKLEFGSRGGWWYCPLPSPRHDRLRGLLTHRFRTHHATTIAQGGPVGPGNSPSRLRVQPSMPSRWLWALALCGLTGCYSQERRAQSLRNACPEYRDLRCLFSVVCIPTQRGCDSCSCDALVPDNRPGYGNKR